MVFQDSKKNKFELNSPGFVRVKTPEGEETLFPYGKDLRLSVSFFSRELRIRFGHESRSLSALSKEQLGEFLLEFFRQWTREAPDSAKKAAFDYVDAQRGFVPVAFVACLLVSFPVSMALLADSHQQFRCTRELKIQAAPGQIEVKKITKKDSRTFKVKLEFVSPQGALIRAEDMIHTQNEKDVPKTLPILYSPEHPECWSLTKSPDSNEINWAKRSYFGFFGLLFGLFFLITTGVGLSWSLARWMNPRPFAREVASLFGFSL